MKIENVEVMGFENAFRGMRNPKESWSKSDSYFGFVNYENDEEDYMIANAWLKSKGLFSNDWSPEQDEEFEKIDKWLLENGILSEDKWKGLAQVAFLGPNDMKLAKQLTDGGSEHRKFLRMIHVQFDLTAPLYW